MSMFLIHRLLTAKDYMTILCRYLTNTAIREKLAPVKLNRYKDDILFYMFYTNVGDVLQMAAAAELYNRDWR